MFTSLAKSSAACVSLSVPLCRNWLKADNGAKQQAKTKVKWYRGPLYSSIISQGSNENVFGS